MVAGGGRVCRQHVCDTAHTLVSFENLRVAGRLSVSRPPPAPKTRARVPPRLPTWPRSRRLRRSTRRWPWTTRLRRKSGRSPAMSAPWTGERGSSGAPLPRVASQQGVHCSVSEGQTTWGRSREAGTAACLAVVSWTVARLCWSKPLHSQAAVQPHVVLTRCTLGRFLSVFGCSVVQEQCAAW
jgi:hypothetical protein